METKDLVLLMLIPIILIGIVVYTDKSPTITGAQTAQVQQKAQDNILGTYSIMPSFRAKIDYNLNDEYKTISEKLSQMVDDCKNEQDVEKCFNDYSNQLNWNCIELRDEAVDILYDFADKFNECINIEEDGIVCRFSLDETSILNLPNTFDIILQNDNQRTKVEVKRGTQVFYDYINLGNLLYTDNYYTKDTASNNADSIKFIINFEGKKPVVQQAVANSNGVPIQLSNKFLFYKVNDEIKFIDATQEGNFRAGIPANRIIDVPKTRGFKFCAKSPSGKQFYAFDKSDNSVKLRDVVYRFAVTYSADIIDKIAPAKAENLKAEVKPNGDIQLKWSKPTKNIDGSTSDDISNFNIYYKKFSVSILPQAIDDSYNKKIITVAEANCESLVKLSCEYTLTGLDKNQIYNIAVTALDKHSNEAIDNADITQINVLQT